MLSPHYTPEEYRDYLQRQYGVNVAASYGKVAQGGPPPRRNRPGAGRPPSTHEVRQAVLGSLASGPKTCRQVQQETFYSRACVNKHLKALVQEGRATRTGSGYFPDGYQYQLKH